MRFVTALLVATAGLAAAQTATTTASSSTSTCLAQNIMDLCKQTTQVQIDNCGGNDWACLCAAYEAQLTCYNQCPGDAGRAPSQNQVTQFCMAASQASSMAAATATTSVSASASSRAASTMTTATSATASSSGSASASSSAAAQGAAGALAVPAGGLLAVALGVFGLL